MQKDKALF